MPAPEKRLKIEITTVADTSGVKETKGAVQELEKTAESGVASVGTAGGKSEAALGKLLSIQKLQIAIELAQKIGMIGDEMRRVAGEVQQGDRELANTLNNTAAGFEMVSGAAQGAAQGMAVGGPYGAAIGGLIGLMTGPLKNAYNDMIESKKQAGLALQREKDSVRALNEAIQLHAAELRAANTAAFWEKETKAIEEAIDAIERKRRITTAEQSAGQAEKKADIAESGMDKVQTGFVQGRSALDSSIEKIRGGIDDATKKADLLGEKASDLATKAKELEANWSVSNDKVESAKSEAKAAETEYDNAVKEADTIRQEGVAKIREEFSKFRESNTGLEQDVEQEATKKAEEIRSVVAGAIEKAGDKASRGSKDALAGLDSLLADRTIKPEEVSKVQTAIDLFLNSAEGRDNAIFNALMSSKTYMSTVDQRFAALQSQLDAQTLAAQRQIDSIRAISLTRFNTR